MERKIEINNLRISFRTNNGAVKAVRGIDLKLYEGETLAIVGESGSGKSVTARALMGILAPNAIAPHPARVKFKNDLAEMIRHFEVRITSYPATRHG